LLAPTFGQAQSAKPFQKEALYGALRLCSAGSNELVRGIQANGVDFRLTADDEQALASLKADPNVLEAIRANYRGSADPAPLPDGPPLTYGEVIGLLQAHRDEAWIAALIQKRAVDFEVTLPGARAILAAGGSTGLVGAIVLNQQQAPLSAGAPAATQQVKPVQLTRDELARKLRRRVAPEFPLQARRLALFGSVVLQVQIDQAGELKAFGKTSGHPVLVDAAKNAVRRWQWEPTLIDRVPVAVDGEVVVEFTR
jgi:protein TonB